MSFEWQGDYLELIDSSGYLRVYNLDPTRSLTIDVVSAPNSNYEIFTVEREGHNYGALGDCPLTLPPLDEFTIYGDDAFPASVTLSLTYTSNLAPLVPAAISSELDETGEERIHVANKVPLSAELCAAAMDNAAWGGSGSNFFLEASGITDAPYWLSTAEQTDLYIDFYDDGTFTHYEWVNEYGWSVAEGSTILPSGSGGHGTIYSGDMQDSICFDWYIPGGV